MQPDGGDARLRLGGQACAAWAYGGHWRALASWHSMRLGGPGRLPQWLPAPASSRALSPCAFHVRRTMWSTAAAGLHRGREVAAQGCGAERPHGAEPMVISPTLDFSRAISSSRSSRSRSFKADAAPASARSRHSVSLATETFASRATTSNGSPRNKRDTTAILR